MNSKKLLKLLAILALAPALAHAAPPRTLIDSTGVAKTVVPTLVIPAAGLSEKNVLTLMESRDFGGGSTIPPGYKEVQVPMGPHDLGLGDGAHGLSYYTGLGYPVVPANGSGCQGNFSPRVLTSPGACRGQGDGGCDPGPSTYGVCEPVGTRYSLEKIVGSEILKVTLAMLDKKVIPPAIGMSNNATTAYCQSMGYVNYVPGTVVADYTDNCSQQITRWNGSKFYNDSACYNGVLKSLQCFK